VTALSPPFFSLSSRAPDIAKVKSKMLFASSKDALRRALVGIGAEIQATDPSEVAHEVGAYPVHPSRSLRSHVDCAFWSVLDKVRR
jgi:hypothetical protein